MFKRRLPSRRAKPPKSKAFVVEMAGVVAEKATPVAAVSELEAESGWASQAARLVRAPKLVAGGREVIPTPAAALGHAAL